MTTMAVPAVRISRDRVFYTGMALFVALVTFIGFAPSYYLSAWLEAPPHTPVMTPVLWAHGLSFTAWVALGVVQPMLIAANNRPLHRKVGWAALVIAGSMVVFGNLAAIAAVQRGFDAFGSPLAFYAIPFFAINGFAVIVALAVWKRNRAETHKRLMLLASTQLVEAAWARIAIAPITGFLPFSFFIASDLIIVAGVAYDLFTRGRVHTVWLWGGGAVIASQAFRLWVMNTEPWLAFARFMTGQG